jgi:hypothetical protein
MGARVRVGTTWMPYREWCAKVERIMRRQRELWRARKRDR